MSPQCCNSSVNHCGFIHPAINLSPRGAAALAVNLNVCWIATPGLQISALVIALRVVTCIWEGYFLFSTSQQIFCLHVSSARLSLRPPVRMIRHEGNGDLLLHRCPGFGLTYPLQSVLCMKSQAPGLNWLCNSSFDLINHLVGGGGAIDTVEWHCVGHDTPDGRVDVIPPPKSQTFLDRGWGSEARIVADTESALCLFTASEKPWFKSDAFQNRVADTKSSWYIACNEFHLHLLDKPLCIFVYLYKTPDKVQKCKEGCIKLCLSALA